MSAVLGRFCLAHINDTHSHFDETALPLRLAMPSGTADIRLHCGGFPRLAGFIKHARQQAIAKQMPFLLLIVSSYNSGDWRLRKASHRRRLPQSLF